MVREVKSITAIGTSGQALGLVFEAKRDRNGWFVLNKKSSKASKGGTNLRVNKVYVQSLYEAATLLETGDYLINLTSSIGTRALREFKSVTISAEPSFKSSMRGV